LASAGPVVGGKRRNRGRGPAVLAALLAVLLLAAGLALAYRGSEEEARVATDASTSTTSSAVAPTFETSSTTLVAPSSIPPVVNSTTPTPEVVGMIETSSSSLTIPRVDASAGPQSGRVTLRNKGTGALTYTTQASSTAITASPGRGTIAPGATTQLTVTLDGSKVTSEGPFSATLSIDGTGGAAKVQVVSIVGSPPRIDEAGEKCPTGTASCSRQIKLSASSVPNPSPCNTVWFYSVTITDSSQIQLAKVIARQGRSNADTQLVAAGQPPGTSGTYQSEPFNPLPPGGALRFAIEAVDQHGFKTRLPEQYISC